MRQYKFHTSPGHMLKFAFRKSRNHILFIQSIAWHALVKINITNRHGYFGERIVHQMGGQFTLSGLKNAIFPLLCNKTRGEHMKRGE